MHTIPLQMPCEMSAIPQFSQNEGIPPRHQSPDLEAMAAGVEMKTAEIVARVDGARQKVSSELQALVASDQIEQVRRGGYLKKEEPDDDLLVI